MADSLAFFNSTTMAAGSRKKYALDLNDIFAFPDGDNIPLRPPNIEEGESWVMLLQVGPPASLPVAADRPPSALFSKNAVLCGDVDFSSTLRKDNGSHPFFRARIDVCDGRHHG